jgi:hypothetical protein
MASGTKTDSDGATQTPEDRLRALYEQSEAATGDALERLVSKPSFGALLAYSAENVAALTRISAEIADLMLRNLRLAGRADIIRLARQLNRTEDKLERVLQEVELLRDELQEQDRKNAGGKRGESAG